MPFLYSAAYDSDLGMYTLYKPGYQADGALGVLYNNLYNVFGFDKITPLAQIIGSHRVHDSGPAADPLNTGFDRLMISPGVEFTKVVDEANNRVLKFYADVEIPFYYRVNAADKAAFQRSAAPRASSSRRSSSRPWRATTSEEGRNGHAFRPSSIGRPHRDKRNQHLGKSHVPPDQGRGPKTAGSNDRNPIMTRLSIGVALAALAANPVLAADMYVKAPAPQTYSWEGLYVGGNVGWLGIEGVGLSGVPADSDTVAFLGPCSAAGACPTSLGGASASSVMGGGQFGFNWQIRNWVVGLLDLSVRSAIRHRVRVGGRSSGSCCSAWRSSSASASRRCSSATGTLMGPCGATVGLGVYALVGVGAYLVALGLGFAALRCLQGEPVRVKSVGFWAALGVGVSVAILLHLALGDASAARPLAGRRARRIRRRAARRVRRPRRRGARSAWCCSPRRWCCRRRCRSARCRRCWRERGRCLVAGSGCARRSRPHGRADLPGARRRRGRRARTSRRPKRSRRRSCAQRRKRTTPPSPTSDADVDEADILAAEKALDAMAQMKRKARKRDDEPQVIKVAGSVAGVRRRGRAGRKSSTTSRPRSTRRRRPDPRASCGPKIVEPLATKKKELAQKAPEPPKPDYIPAAGGYHLPDTSLLDYEESHEDKIDKGAMLALADKLQKTLADYGVKGHVAEIHPGPVVTMYEFVPAPGTKLSKITALSNDLAMALEALRVRIVAPIPGKGAVGIEVPNKTRETVFLKEILVDEGVQKAKSKLTMGLGKDIAGAPVAVDLAKMPHLLVAGTTGSGKSVAVNGMICSILFNATPEEVRMIMIDPKMLELSIYEGIPHLLLPVVTDPKKANLALRWAVDEMERRYELVSKAGVRDIVGYNKKVEKHPRRRAAEVRAEEDQDLRRGRGRRAATRSRCAADRGGGARGRRRRRRRDARRDLAGAYAAIAEGARRGAAAAAQAALHRRHHRRVRRPHDGGAEGGRDLGGAHRAEGARRRHPPAPRRRSGRRWTSSPASSRRTSRRASPSRWRRRSTRAPSSTSRAPRTCSAWATCCSPIAARRCAACTARS